MAQVQLLPEDVRIALVNGRRDRSWLRRHVQNNPDMLDTVFKVNPDDKPDFFLPPIAMCIAFGNWDCAEAVQDASASRRGRGVAINLHEVTSGPAGEPGWDLLAVAIMNGQLDMAKKLIKDYGFTMRSGCGPDGRSSHLHACAAMLEDDPAMVDFVWEHTSHPEEVLACPDSKGFTPILAAAHYSNFRVMMRLLHMVDEDRASQLELLRQRANEGQTILILCAMGILDMDSTQAEMQAVCSSLKYICKQCPDLINEQDDEGCTALHYLGDSAISKLAVKILTRNGADPTIKDNEGAAAYEDDEDDEDEDAPSDDDDNEEEEYRPAGKHNETSQSETRRRSPRRAGSAAQSSSSSSSSSSGGAGSAAGDEIEEHALDEAGEAGGARQGPEQHLPKRQRVWRDEFDDNMPSFSEYSSAAAAAAAAASPASAASAASAAAAGAAGAASAASAISAAAVAAAAAAAAAALAGTASSSTSSPAPLPSGLAVSMDSGADVAAAGSPDAPSTNADDSIDGTDDGSGGLDFHADSPAPMAIGGSGAPAVAAAASATPPPSAAPVAKPPAIGVPAIPQRWRRLCDSVGIEPATYDRVQRSLHDSEGPESDAVDGMLKRLTSVLWLEKSNTSMQWDLYAFLRSIYRREDPCTCCQ